MNWKLRHADTHHVATLVDELKISPTLAKILIHRKIDSPAAVKKFLETRVDVLHDPFLLNDMAQATHRVIEALHRKQKICIYGDYDVDGIVATSLLMLFFRELNVEVDYYIPHRIVEGYALNLDSMDEMDKRGIKLIITVDNGVSSHAAIGRANELGIDVIVTDHHQITQSLPLACAVINPHRRDSQYPFKEISGAGVAFKFMMGLRKALREAGFFKEGNGPHLKQYVDLVALATVCDVVPLLDENRYFVKEGLRLLSMTQNVGLKALAQVADIHGRTPTVTDLGFRLGPRLNACGRMEDADLGVQLLTTTDVKQASEIAQTLDRLNQERQAVEKTIVGAVFQKIEHDVDLQTTLGLVVYNPEWHEGVVGIVASRVVEKYRRPTFVLSRAENGLIKGSGRSVSSVSLIHAVAQCSDLLEKFGGHEMAAGVSLKEENLPAFVSAFDQAVKRQMSFDDLKSVIRVDDILEPHQISEELMAELQKLEPYGLGNARPVFVSGELAVRSKRVVGQSHLKMFVGDSNQAFEAIAFDQGDRLENIGSTTRLLFQLEKNVYQNVERIQLNVKGIIT